MSYFGTILKIGENSILTTKKYATLSIYTTFGTMENKCTVIKLSSPKLVDNCTYGAIAFPCITCFLIYLSNFQKKILRREICFACLQ